jgi:hypothetical protein
VSIEASFQVAVERCGRVCEQVSELRMTVIEDRPLRDVVKLVDHIGDTVEDLLGGAQEMREAATEAQCAVQHPMDAEQARRALIACHTKFNHCAIRFFSDLANYETVDEVLSLGRARGGEWQAWANLVKETLKQCQQTLFAVNEALLECWQGVAERAGVQAVTVQTTNVGSLSQKIRRA